MARSRYPTQGKAAQPNGRHTRHVKRACDTCRVKRYKCDAGRPCGQCTASHCPCEYTACVDLRRNLNKEEAVALNNKIALLESENKQLRQDKTFMSTQIWQLTQQLAAAKAELRGRRGPSPPVLSITTTMTDDEHEYELQMPSPYLSSPSDGPPSSTFPSTPLQHAGAMLYSENEISTANTMHLQVPSKGGYRHQPFVTSQSNISDGDVEGLLMHATTLTVPSLKTEPRQWLYPSSPSSSISDGMSQLEMLFSDAGLNSPSMPSMFDAGNGTMDPVASSSSETYGEQPSLFPGDTPIVNLPPNIYFPS